MKKSKKKPSPKTPSEKAPVGRPSDYNQEIADVICTRIAKGETLAEICKDIGVDRVTVYRWTRKDEEFRHQYAQAREDQMHSFADQILEKARDESRDYFDVEYEKLNKNGEVVASRKERRSDNTAVQRDRLIVDSMKFLMARLAPRFYGDKVEQTIQGPGGSGLVVNVLITRKAKNGEGNKP